MWKQNRYIYLNILYFYIFIDKTKTNNLSKITTWKYTFEIASKVRKYYILAIIMEQSLKYK